MAVEGTDLIGALGAEELGQTVEQYLQAQCDARVDSLKRHMEDKISEFAQGVKRGRQALVEIANPPSEEPAPAAAASKGPLCDPFALVAIRGSKAGMVVKLEPTEKQTVWKVGRDKAADIALVGDDEVSSTHAQVAFDKKQWKLMDLGSTNGTVATTGTNFKAVTLKKMRNHVLKVNHLVTFGNTTFRWCYFSDVETVLEQAEVPAATK